MRHNNHGCLPPVKDVRDYKLAKVAGVVALPEVYKVKWLPRTKNQGSVSSCVAHASSSILEYHALNEGNTCYLSTDFIYGIQKQLCGHEGSGMYLRDACKIVKTYGDMLESDCPGNTEVPKSHKVAEKALEDTDKVSRASAFKINSYVNLSTNNDIKRAIMNYGPVLASVRWYDTFKLNSNDALVGEQKGDYGYHAIMLCGWCSEGFVAQNSWGTNWGNAGRFILPYTIPIAEAWQWIDEDVDVIKPVRNKFTDFIYKVLNIILNWLRSLGDN